MISWSIFKQIVFNFLNIYKAKENCFSLVSYLETTLMKSKFIMKKNSSLTKSKSTLSTKIALSRSTMSFKSNNMAFLTRKYMNHSQYSNLSYTQK